MALVSDPSLEGFNSFVSVDEADAYFEGVYFGDSKKWSDFTDDVDKEALLITATRRLSSLPWKGTPYGSLAFPRNFSSEYGWKPHPHMAPVPVSGWPFPEVEGEPEDYVPGWLKQATCEMALWIWTEGDRPATDAEFGMLKSQKIGPLSYEYRDGTFGVSPSVFAILKSLGSNYIDLGVGPRSMSMVY